MSYRRGYAGGGSRGFNRGFPKPVEVGKEYDVEVTVAKTNVVTVSI